MNKTINEILFNDYKLIIEAYNTIDNLNLRKIDINIWSIENGIEITTWTTDLEFNKKEINSFKISKIEIDQLSELINYNNCNHKLFVKYCGWCNYNEILKSAPRAKEMVQKEATDKLKYNINKYIDENSWDSEYTKNLKVWDKEFPKILKDKLNKGDFDNEMF